MGGDAADPLLLGQRVVAILETGLRTATYKLATLMALIEHCLENMPERPGDVLRVPIPDLAHRVLEIYWQQVRSQRAGEVIGSFQNETRPLAFTSLPPGGLPVSPTRLAVTGHRVKFSRSDDAPRPLRSHDVTKEVTFPRDRHLVYPPITPSVCGPVIRAVAPCLP